LHVGEGQLNPGSLHTEISGVLHLLVNVGRHQHLLRGDTTAQGARAAKARVFFNHRRLKAQLARAYRRHIAARPTTNNRYVKLFVSQCVEFLSRDAGSAGILPAMSAVRRERSDMQVAPTVLSYRYECFLFKTGIIIIRRSFIQLSDWQNSVSQFLAPLGAKCLCDRANQTLKLCWSAMQVAQLSTRRDISPLRG
jgi:hypothetical protein